jgi:hypothetical protein
MQKRLKRLRKLYPTTAALARDLYCWTPAFIGQVINGKRQGGSASLDKQVSMLEKKLGVK